MVLEWNDSLATGIDLVDGQHKELILRVARLEQALEDAQAEQTIQSLITFLENYVIKHFSDEEALMQKHHYPDYETHHKQHVAFIANFKEIKETYTKEGVSMAVRAKLKVQVNSWLVSHINIVDKKVASFLKKQGVE